jgi:hypothetical protein
MQKWDTISLSNHDKDIFNKKISPLRGIWAYDLENPNSNLYVFFDELIEGGVFGFETSLNVKLSEAAAFVESNLGEISRKLFVREATSNKISTLFELGYFDEQAAEEDADEKSLKVYQSGLDNNLLSNISKSDIFNNLIHFECIEDIRVFVFKNENRILFLSETKTAKQSMNFIDCGEENFCNEIVKNANMYLAEIREDFTPRYFFCDEETIPAFADRNGEAYRDRSDPTL